EEVDHHRPALEVGQADPAGALDGREVEAGRVGDVAGRAGLRPARSRAEGDPGDHGDDRHPEDAEYPGEPPLQEWPGVRGCPLERRHPRLTRRRRPSASRASFRWVVIQIRRFIARSTPKKPRATAETAVIPVEWRLTQLSAPASRPKARPVARNGIPSPSE